MSDRWTCACKPARGGQPEHGIARPERAIDGDTAIGQQAERATSPQAQGHFGRREALALVAGLGLGVDPAAAQDVAKIEPRSYRVLLENDKVRVIEYLARPGLGVCGAGRHSHPDHVTVVLTPAKVKLRQPDGKLMVASIDAGTVLWEPAATHSAENIGGSGTRMVLVELKDKHWVPSTG
jgi:beta-alanine degradation protein BauB